MTLRDTIKKLCKEAGISINKLESDLGFAKGYISKLDKSTPNSAKLQKIADYFGVSLDYLMTGKEPTLNCLYNDENADLLIEITMKLKSDKAFAERMSRYIRLSDEGKKYADNSIDLMYLKEHEGED